jgi:inosine/xanthosine triphosphatase
MLIFVGSKNPVKINSVINAGSETWPELKVIGIDVPSGISEQPMSDDETRLGAENRARTVLQEGLKTLSKEEIKNETILGIGLEGGVFERSPKELWSTVWTTVTNQQGDIFESNGAGFKVPKIISDRILAGEEMGPIMGTFLSDPNIKQKKGAIGVITKGFIDRTEEYTTIVKLALGLYFGQGWDKEITSTKK